MVKATLGERLKLLREEKDLSQEEMGHSFNLKQSSFSCYENNTKQPSIDTLIKLADFFNVSIDYLVGRSDSYDPEYVADGEKPYLPAVFEVIKNKVSGLDKELFSILQDVIVNCSPEQKSDLLVLIKVLIKQFDNQPLKKRKIKKNDANQKENVVGVHKENNV